MSCCVRHRRRVAFVAPGGAVDGEAWRRGVTDLPARRAGGLHPPRLAEDAASLLPDVERPAVVFAVRVDPDGGAARRRRAIRHPQPCEARVLDGHARRPARRFEEFARAHRAGGDPAAPSGSRPPNRKWTGPPTGSRCGSGPDRRSKSRARRCRWRRTWRWPTPCTRPARDSSERWTASTSASGGSGTPRKLSGSSGRRTAPGRFPPIAPVRRRAHRRVPAGGAARRGRGGYEPYARASCHGMRQWPRPTAMPPLRCGGWPTGTSSRRRWRSSPVTPVPAWSPRRSTAARR